MFFSLPSALLCLAGVASLSPFVVGAPVKERAQANRLGLVVPINNTAVLDHDVFQGFWAPADSPIWAALDEFELSADKSLSQQVLLANAFITGHDSDNLATACGQVSDLLLTEVKEAVCGQEQTESTLTGEEVSTDSTVASVERRSRWRWLKSAKHTTSTIALNLLSNYLYDNYRNLPSSPRSVCVNADGTNACISWSKAESFNSYYAHQFVDDGTSFARDSGLSWYSLQTNGALGSRSFARRSGADVCLSNRADGCT